MAPLQDPYDRLLEEKRRLDLTFERFVASYETAPLRQKFDMYWYLDKARAELDLSTHWIDRLQQTLDAALKAGMPKT